MLMQRYADALAGCMWVNCVAAIAALLACTSHAHCPNTGHGLLTDLHGLRRRTSAKAVCSC